MADTWLGDPDLDADLDAVADPDAVEARRRRRGSLQKRNNIRKLVIHSYDCNLV